MVGVLSAVLHMHIALRRCQLKFSGRHHLSARTKRREPSFVSNVVLPMGIGRNSRSRPGSPNKYRPLKLFEGSRLLSWIKRKPRDTCRPIFAFLD